MVNFFNVAPYTVSNKFLQLFLNLFPDFCWAYSFTSSIVIVNARYFNSNYLLLLVAAFFVIFQEFVQLLMPRYFTLTGWMSLKQFLALACLYL